MGSPDEWHTTRDILERLGISGRDLDSTAGNPTVRFQ